MSEMDNLRDQMGNQRRESHVHRTKQEQHPVIMTESKHADRTM